MDRQFGFTKNSLTTIWSSLSVFLVFYSLDSWLATQGQKPLFSRIIDERPSIAALFGIPVGSVLLLLSIWMLFSYMKHFHRDTWDSKYPLFSNLELNTGTRESKIFQGFCLFIFLIIPIAAQVHFMNKFLGGTAIFKDNCASVSVSIYKLYCPTIFFQKGCDIFRYGEIEGVTFFPLYQPVLYVSIQSFVLYLFVSYLTALFQNLKKHKTTLFLVIYLMYFSLIFFA